jgi:hypothetical protein
MLGRAITKSAKFDCKVQQNSARRRTNHNKNTWLYSKIVGISFLPTLLAYKHSTIIISITISNKILYLVFRRWRSVLVDCSPNNTRFCMLIFRFLVFQVKQEVIYISIIEKIFSKSKSHPSYRIPSCHLTSHLSSAAICGKLTDFLNNTTQAQM